MLDSIRNIFSIPDLRKRIIFTLFILAVYRIGWQVPNPGISGAALQEFWEQQRGTILGFVDLFSGRNMSKMTIFALGIMPISVPLSFSSCFRLSGLTWKDYLRKENSAEKKSPNTRVMGPLLSAPSRLLLSLCGCKPKAAPVG